MVKQIAARRDVILSNYSFVFFWTRFAFIRCGSTNEAVQPMECFSWSFNLRGEFLFPSNELIWFKKNTFFLSFARKLVRPHISLPAFVMRSNPLLSPPPPNDWFVFTVRKEKPKKPKKKKKCGLCSRAKTFLPAHHPPAPPPPGQFVPLVCSRLCPPTNELGKPKKKKQKPKA